MSQKIDPTGFPKGVWGVVLDYAAPITRDAIVYKVDNRPLDIIQDVLRLGGGPYEELRFNYLQIAQTFKNHLEFGHYYDLPKVDQQIRIFAMTTFVVGFGCKLVRDQKMNLCDSFIDRLNRKSYLPRGISDGYPILHRLGLIGERANGLAGPVEYFPISQPDEPKETVTLEKSDVTVEDVTPPQS